MPNHQAELDRAQALFEDGEFVEAGEVLHALARGDSSEKVADVVRQMRAQLDGFLELRAFNKALLSGKPHEPERILEPPPHVRLRLASVGFLCWIVSFSFQWLYLSDGGASFVLFVIGTPLLGGILVGLATRGRGQWVALAAVGLFVMLSFSAVLLGSPAFDEGGGTFALGMALVAATGLAGGALCARDVHA